MSKYQDLPDFPTRYCFLIRLSLNNNIKFPKVPHVTSHKFFKYACTLVALESPSGQGVHDDVSPTLYNYH